MPIDYERDSRERAERFSRRRRNRNVFLSNLDPIWYIGAGFLALGLTFKFFTQTDLDNPTIMMGSGTFVLAIASIFVGIFLYFTRNIEGGTINSDEDTEGSVRHKIIPAVLILATILTFIGLEIADAISASASEVGSGSSEESVSSISGFNYELSTSDEVMYLASCEISTCNSSLSFTINSELVSGAELIAFPIYVGSTEAELSQIHFNCISGCGNAGEYLRLAIYEDNGSLQFPGNLCKDLGALELVSGTGFYSIVSSGTPCEIANSNIYWISIRFEEITNYSASGSPAVIAEVATGGSSLIPFGVESVASGGDVTNVYNNWGVAVSGNACNADCSNTFPATFPTINASPINFNTMGFPAIWYELN